MIKPVSAVQQVQDRKNPIQQQPKQTKKASNFSAVLAEVRHKSSLQ